MTDTIKEPFNPRNHLRQLSGKDYLDVRYRIQWFRDVYPLGTIKTYLVTDEYTLDEVEKKVGPTTKTEKGVSKFARAVFRAEISIPSPDPATFNAYPTILLATGFGMEEKGDFSDYFEKAETKAIGRALGAAGFGTQFTDDFDFTADNGEQKVVDAPVNKGAFSFGGKK